MRTPPIQPHDDEKIIHLLRREKYDVRDDRSTKPGGLLWVRSIDRAKEEAFFARQKERGYDFRYTPSSRRLDGKPGWWWEQKLSPWGTRRPQKELRLLAVPIAKALGQEVLRNPSIASVVVDEVAAELRRNPVTLKSAQAVVEKLRRELRAPSQQPERTTKDLLKEGF